MIRRVTPLAVLILIIIFFCYPDRASAAQDGRFEEGKAVVEIEIRGNKRIEAATIKSRIKTKIGKPVSADQIRGDIKSVYGLGFFSDVRVGSEPKDGGVKLIYNVSERPLVVEIDFVGNSAILVDKLKEHIAIEKQSFLDDLRVKESAAALVRYYDEEGYYNTVVIPALGPGLHAG